MLQTQDLKHIPAYLSYLSYGQTCRYCNGYYGWKFIKPCQCSMIHENCMRELVHQTATAQSQYYGYLEYKCPSCSCISLYRNQLTRKTIPCPQMTSFEIIQIVWFSFVLVLMGGALAASIILEYSFEIKVVQWIILLLCGVIFPYRMYIVSTCFFYESQQHNQSADLNE